MLKKDFPIFANNQWLVYLDSAATLQKPQCVIDGVSAYLSHDYANVHRGRYTLSEKSELLYWETRKLVAELLWADDEEVIFTSNSTDSVNKLVKSLVFSWRIKNWDTVLLSELEHHANIVPRQIAAKEHHFSLEYVWLNEQQQIDLDDLAAKLHSGVKVVSLTMVSNVTGWVSDVKKIVDLVNKSLRLQQAVENSLNKGDLDSLSRPLLILDVSQAVPHMLVEVKKLGIDFCYFTGHKLGAHTGIWILWWKKEHLRSLTPGYGWWGMVDEVTKEWFSMQWAPDKFEPGTPNLVGAVSIKYALEYIKSLWSEQTFASWYTHLASIEDSLITYCLEQFAELASLWITLLWPKDPTKRVGVFSFQLPVWKNATQLGQFMAEKNICIRCGAQCAHIFHAWLTDHTWWKSCIQHTCRISLWWYTDIEDVVKFFTGLKLFLT